jgi:hypothetical protein
MSQNAYLAGGVSLLRFLEQRSPLQLALHMSNHLAGRLKWANNQTFSQLLFLLVQACVNYPALLRHVLIVGIRKVAVVDHLGQKSLAADERR